MMVRETGYDEVRDAQRHFRSILDSLARPGVISILDPVTLAPPPRLNAATVLVAFSLLDADVAFHLVDMTASEDAYLRANTRAASTAIEDAQFVFADGSSPAQMLEGVHCGSLTYPDTAATLILQVVTLSSVPVPAGLKLTLTGPGVETQAFVYVRQLNPDLLLALQARNTEFPLGIDTIVTCDDGPQGIPRVLGIPRTTTVRWEHC